MSLTFRTVQKHERKTASNIIKLKNQQLFLAINGIINCLSPMGPVFKLKQVLVGLG